jgi:hypothetical protein
MVKNVLVTIIILALVGGMGFFWIEWNSAQQALYAARISISSLESTVNSQESELATTKDELQTVKAELEANKDYSANVAGELEATQLKLSAIQTDMLHLHNPTFAEVTSFLTEDKTDSNEYIDDTYVCSHFARDVNNNAESQGIRCAYVDVRYPDSAHAIVAFDTIDEGLLYFDPSSDESVKPVVGKEYWRCIVPKPGYYYEKPSFDDTIIDILVVW